MLRWIDEVEGVVFVPELSLILASGLAITSLLLIVYFLHRVALAMQAQNVASVVADDLDAAMLRLYPEQLGEIAIPHNMSESQLDWSDVWRRFDDGPVGAIEAASEGYL